MSHESEIWSQMSAISTTSIYNNIVFLLEVIHT